MHVIFDGANIVFFFRDKTSICKTLQARAQHLREQGPRKITTYALNQMRSALTSRLEDIKGEKTFNENVFIAIDIYNRILSLYNAYKGNWKTIGKYASRYLERNDPEFRKNYISSFERFIKTKDETHLIPFIETFLERVGGPLHFLSWRNQHELPVHDKLVIYIKPPLLQTGLESSSALQLLYNFKVFLNRHVPNVSCSFLQNFDDTTLAQGIYIVFHWDNTKIIEQLLPLVQSFHFNLEQSWHAWRNNWSYPSDIDPIEVYGNIEVQKQIASILAHVNTTFFGNLTNTKSPEKVSFETAFHVLKHFEALNFFEQNAKMATLFWDEAMRCFLNLKRTGMQASTAQLLEFYNIRDLEHFAKLFSEHSQPIKAHLYDTKADFVLKTKLLELEEFYTKTPEAFCDRYDFVHWDVDSKDKKFASLLFSLVEKVHQACFLEKERAYNVYCLQRYFQAK